jgi:hypothetical protein
VIDRWPTHRGLVEVYQEKAAETHRRNGFRNWAFFFKDNDRLLGVCRSNSSGIEKLSFRIS